MNDIAVQALADSDRPREKLAASGPGALTDTELLALVLRSGERGNDALAQAGLILKQAESLRGLGRLGFGDLRHMRGIGPAKAAQIVALAELCKRFGETPFLPGQPFRNSRDIYNHFCQRLAVETREQFFAVLLDNRHRKIRDVRVAEGSLTTAIVHPRDVYLPVLREAAAAVVFVHNHPSGDPTPSREDHEITRRLREVGELVGVRVLDHIVIGRGSYVSFVDNGMW